jgi:hypothetical protein
MPGFQVWESAEKLLWTGWDQEDAFLAALQHRRPGVSIEVLEAFDLDGYLRPRRVAACIVDEVPS